MKTKTVQDLIREDFIESLIGFTDGKITDDEANKIADAELHYEDFNDDSPLAHKGPRWLAKDIARCMGLWEYKKEN